MTPIERATTAVMHSMGDGPGSRDRLRAEAIARAVIEAIREPSEAMVAEAQQSFVLGQYQLPALIRVCHGAMIDALLEEGA